MAEDAHAVESGGTATPTAAAVSVSADRVRDGYFDVIEINDDDEDPDAEEDAPVEADECCICRDVVELLMQGFLPVCDHKFHFECIVAWSKVTNLCPLCKTKFNSVTRIDASGAVIHTEEVADQKQVFRPDPQDHDIAAQLRLVNEARCESCGRGDDEHVLLMCEARGCPVASHTYCIGLGEVPSSSWYCSRHASGTRASDFIERPATTVSSRRTTRRLAHLMSNVLSGRGANLTTGAARRARATGTREGRGGDSSRRSAAARVTLESDSGRPIRGIAAAYALRMSQELQQIHRRAELMYARGDHNQFALTGAPSNRHLVLSRSTIPASSSSSNVDVMWRDFETSRQEIASANAPDVSSMNGSRRQVQAQLNARVSRTLAPEYRELAQLMVDAVSSDNYASTVSLLIPKTAKLRLVSRVKTFFACLNEREKVVVLDMGCLSVLFKWVQRPSSESGAASSSSPLSAPHPQVLDAVLTVVEALPIRKNDLVETPEFQSTLDEIATLSDVSVEMRERAILTSEQWQNVNPPPAQQTLQPPLSSTLSRPVSRENATTNAQNLPSIRKFSAQKQPNRRPKEKTRKPDTWSAVAVEYVKAKLYPLYKHSEGKLTKERFKEIVKQVVEMFRGEAEKMQSQIVLSTGELSNIAKTRLKTLLDRAYKGSSSNSDANSSAVRPTPNRPGAAMVSSYSAVPSTKHRRIT